MMHVVGSWSGTGPRKAPELLCKLGGHAAILGSTGKAIAAAVLSGTWAAP